MIWCGIVTLFPEMFATVSHWGMTKRAIQQKKLLVSYWNPRDYARDKHRTVDDKPYGGGPGMVMKVEPLQGAIHAAKACAPGLNPKVICLSPQGKRVTQADIERIKDMGEVIFVCGRYEGIDERLLELEVDEQWSIGDFVLSGGELPVMMLVDAAVRLIPGVLGDIESAKQDSFTDGLLEHPQYTRPEKVKGLEVPGVLLSGNHAKIEAWRRAEKLRRTSLKRPDLLEDQMVRENET